MKNNLLEKKQKKFIDLFLLARTGDELAYRDLLLDISVVLRAYLSRHIILAELRELVLQNVLLVVHESFHTFNGEKNFAKWLYSVTKYKTIQELRNYHLTFERSFNYLEFEKVFLEESLKLELSSDKDINLALLTKEEQRILKFFEKKDLSINKTANYLGLSSKELRKKIRNIYINFRQNLAER